MSTVYRNFITNVLDWHRFGFGSYFTFWCQPDPDTDPTSRCTQVRNSEIFTDFYFTLIPVYTVLSFFSICHRCPKFQHFRQNIEIFWKKYGLSLHLVQINTDPDSGRQALDADPYPAKAADPTGSGSTTLHWTCLGIWRGQVGVSVASHQPGEEHHEGDQQQSQAPASLG